MTLVLSGPISMGDINVELGRARTEKISLDTAENNGYVAINQNSASRPSSTNPATISEWRGYNHSAVAPDTTPPPRPIINLDFYNGSVFSIAWEPVSDPSGILRYQIFFGTIPDPPYYDEVTFEYTSYLFDAVAPNTTYYVTVTAVDGANNVSRSSNMIAYKTASACFVEGTIITLWDGTQMPIEKLVVNQLLLSAEIETLRDTNNVNELYKWNSGFLQEKRISAPITQIEPKVASKTIIINDGLLEATPSHSQLIQRDGLWKFISLGDVIVGDNLYGINKEIIPITIVSVSLEKRKIYPLTLSPSHTYFANGILTHNIKQPI
jgi:hypothetical protein